MLLDSVSSSGRPRAAQESEWIRQIATGDARALAALYDQYAPLLHGLVLGIVKRREEAEDVLQEVFVRVWERSAGFDESKGNVYAWLVTMARNRAIDRIRSKGFRVLEGDTGSEEDSYGGWTAQLQSDDLSPLDQLEMGERADLVRRALHTLPTEQREALHIAYYSGLSQSEISEREGIPLGTVKTRMRQGMIKLERILRGRL